ncbi:MAG: hypothetical protein JNM18_05500 [Planctomycetaceae bacterium]|nr:hypothetical protein [Planctomycetaceae bacterium]
MLEVCCLVVALCGQLDVLPDARFSAPLPAMIRVADRADVSEAVGARLLSLHVVDERGELGEPMWGRYQRRGERVVFTPRFPLDPAVNYRLRYLNDHGKPQIVAVPVGTGEKFAGDFRVTEIYPSADTVPANLLKFYIHFSAPVREGREIFEQITIVDDQGVTIPAPWLLTELWNADSTRLTLRIHPGRIKQGVNLRETEGLVLQPGRRYSLRVSREVQHATAGRGRVQLKTEFIKSFRVAAEDHSLPTVAQWRVTAPRTGSREPLVIEFPDPLDPHLARRCIQIRDPANSVVTGEIKIAAHETRWTLTPEREWISGTYRIEVDDVLEDLAGNTPTRPFEVDANKPLARLPSTLDFQTRPE